jgi:hypothetical protein
MTAGGISPPLYLPPDCSLIGRPHARGSRRGSHFRATAPRVFVTTRACTDMTRRRHHADADEIMEAAQADHTDGTATSGSFSFRGPRHVTPPSMSDDLSAVLDMSITFGTKLWETTFLLAIVNACKPVKDAGDFLLLRETLSEELGPAYMWLIMLSVVEWDTLLDDQKEQNTEMRLAWLSSYSKVSEAVLHLWFWKLLKKKTEAFAPLRERHRVFTKIRPGSPNCGTEAWTEIFLLYPITGSLPAVSRRVSVSRMTPRPRAPTTSRPSTQACLNSVTCPPCRFQSSSPSSPSWVSTSLRSI